MSSINILNVVLKNPISKFTDKIVFEIVFECLSELKDDIEFKVVYVGSAEDESFDQELESVLIGPLQIGTMKFELEANAPDPQKIPQKDLIGITAVLVTCSYNQQEFFRVGYFVHVCFDNEEMNLNLPENIDLDKVLKNILSEKPRVTKFSIEWDKALNDIPSFTKEDEIHEVENNNENILYDNFQGGNKNFHMNNLNNRMGNLQNQTTNFSQSGSFSIDTSNNIYNKNQFQYQNYPVFEAQKEKFK